MTNILLQVREGMKVSDSTGAEIGTVEYVKMTDEDPSRPGPETITAQGQQQAGGGGLMGAIADAFRTDSVPEVVQARLMREGFIRMDAAGIFNADRYILPDQIASVAGDRVTLRVTKDQLAKRS